MAIEPAEVRRIKTETGSHIEPSFDESWDKATKLAWHAGVVLEDTGIRITIGEPETPGGYYSINMGNSGTGPFHFDDAWVYISGISAGARECERLHDEYDRWNWA